MSNIYKKILITNMGVKKGEKVLVLIDKGKEKIGNSFLIAANELGCDTQLITLKERKIHGDPPPTSVAKLMKEMDVIIAPTEFSISHTKARKAATKAGVRIASMPLITDEMFKKGGMTANFSSIKGRINKVFEIITHFDTAHLITRKGTELEMRLNPRRWLKDDGVFTKTGSFGNLPAGEIYIAPIEGTANGKLVIDGAMAGIGELEKPITIHVKDGFARIFKGGDQAKKLRKLLDKSAKLLQKEGRNPKTVLNIAELGIGMNDNAKIIGNPLEDEKVFGTVHIALGDNSTIGGNVESNIHLDGIIKKPTLIIGNQIILRNGEFRIE